MKSKNVFLVGLMGSGKSSIGRLLAESLGLSFYDSDQAIEQRCGVSVSWIFDYEGEEGFRRRETQVIAELTLKEKIVLATGGGAILAEQNRQFLRERGWVIYLQTEIDQLLDRLQYAQNRPLLQRPDRKEVMTELLKKRDPLYREVADLIIETNQQRLPLIVDDIIKGLKKLGYGK